MSTPKAKTPGGLKSPRSTATASGWRTKVRKGMKEVCPADKVDEALAAVLNAPEAKLAQVREVYCQPYKPVLWGPFLVALLGQKKADALLEGGATSPVKSMKTFPVSEGANVVSPKRRPPAPGASPHASPVRSPRGGRSTAAAKRESSLDYAAVAAMGVLLAVAAVGCSKEAMASVDVELNKLVKYASSTLKVDQAAIDWVTKVLTVGGTLALSGGVVGAVIIFLAGVVVFAIFANKN